MADSSHDSRNLSTVHHKNRRRALLVALLGAGAPLSQKVIPGKWVAPVVDAVMLPVHAQTSQAAPIGTFGSADIARSNATGSAFDNIAERTEEEILNLFVDAAEAAGCDTSTCSDDGDVQVNVVATISENPTNNACIQAQVKLSGGSCAPNSLFFDFQNVSVDGQAVSISESCELTLSNMVLTDAGLSGQWSYHDSTNTRTASDQFFAAADALGGCLS